MRCFGIVLCLFFVFASAVWASDLTRLRAPTKGNSHVRINPGQPDDREGGETIEDAFLIDTLPYIDMGNTCGNINDYDEVCPYSGSTSPDVVYSFTPGMDMVVMLDLCREGNQYDTKIYVYENMVTPGVPHACNDDFCSNDWTSYASRLERVPLFAGNTYYIVIDGYGGDCGNYELLMGAPPPVPVECGPDHVPEGEPPMPDGYVDIYNPGCCCSGPPIFQDLDWIDGSGCAHLCGVSGWWTMPAGFYCDTDWFQVTDAAFQLDIEINTEHFMQVLISAPNPTCATVVWDAVQTINPNTPTSWAIPTNPGDVHWFWVGPGEWVDLPDFIYTLEVCGIQYDVVPTETASWGGVKAMYR